MTLFSETFEEKRKKIKAKSSYYVFRNVQEQGGLLPISIRRWGRPFPFLGLPRNRQEKSRFSLVLMHTQNANVIWSTLHLKRNSFLVTPNMDALQIGPLWGGGHPLHFGSQCSKEQQVHFVLTAMNPRASGLIHNPSVARFPNSSSATTKNGSASAHLEACCQEVDGDTLIWTAS